MKPTTPNNTLTACAYCGSDCSPEETVFKNEQPYCCFGCATLHEVLQSNPDLVWSEDEVSVEYKQYDLPEVFNQLVDFQNDRLYKISISTPAIHCSSCVELLEDLPELNEHILLSRVNFEERELSLTIEKSLALSSVATLLEKLGYPPQFNVSKQAQSKNKKANAQLLRKVAVAGFCFGNSMMFTMPHYFGLTLVNEVFFADLFRYLNVALSFVVLAYPARDYFTTAYQAVIRKKAHIDIPIVLGVIAIWAWSLYEIFSGTGFGYMDSLAGLIFFLLVGKWYQNKVYSRISFERSIHDFLPLTVRQKGVEGNVWTRVDDLRPGDILIVKHGEVIPVDGLLVDGNGQVDYSFVTGESLPEQVTTGQNVFIGGKQLAGAIEVQVQEKPDTSKIWAAWQTPKDEHKSTTHWTVKVSMYFTPIVIGLAIASGLAWLFIDPSKAIFVFSSVLIVACPCALALSTPFTMGSVVRVFAKNGLFLKSSDLVEELSHSNHIIFDKTGTLTETSNLQIEALFNQLSDGYETDVVAALEQSSHPISLALLNYLGTKTEAPTVTDFKEILGLGIEANVNGNQIRVGSEAFVYGQRSQKGSHVFVQINGDVRAHFALRNTYKPFVKDMLRNLGEHSSLSVLTGDNAGEQEALQKLYGDFEALQFDSKPEDKQAFVAQAHVNGDHTLMVGDGLNDQIALNQSHVGLAVSDSINGFYPSADGILVDNSFEKLPKLLALAKQSKTILKYSLAFSVFYNLIGIAFAVAGSLTPIVAAILMPLSSITVVGLVTALVSFNARKLQLV